jgi:hypothetical protein
VQARSNPTPEAVLNNNTVYVYYFDQATDGQQLVFQLAHEVIHVLAGVFRRDARIFEEGWAVEFSLSRVSEAYRRRCESGAGIAPLFREAHEKFRQLRATPVRIQKLRKACAIDDITPEILQRVFNAPSDLAAALCQRVSVHDSDRL